MDLYCLISRSSIEALTPSGNWAQAFHGFCQKYLGSLTALSLSVVMFEAFAESVLQLILLIYTVVFVGYNPGINLKKGQTIPRKSYVYVKKL